MKPLQNSCLNIAFTILATLAFVSIVHRCEPLPKTHIKTQTKTIVQHDTLVQVHIEKVPKVVYVERQKSRKGHDSIVYIKKPSKTSLKANLFTTTLTSQQALAHLKITTTGQLLDVQGHIDYPKVVKTQTIENVRAKSGLFLYANTTLGRHCVGIGALYQFKDAIVIMGGTQYDNLTKRLDGTLGIGIRIF